MRHHFQFDFGDYKNEKDARDVAIKVYNLIFKCKPHYKVACRILYKKEKMFEHIRFENALDAFDKLRPQYDWDNYNDDVELAAIGKRNFILAEHLLQKPLKEKKKVFAAWRNLLANKRCEYNL